MNFIIKSASSFSPNYSFKYEKPIICPYCGISTDASYTKKDIYQMTNGVLLTATCNCTSCLKSFFHASFHKTDDPECAKNVCLFPSVEYEQFQNKNIAAFSPRFIDLYNQALNAEFCGNIDIAAIGFRASLEVLIKDHAINVLHEDESQVSKMKLIESISRYLSKDLANSADVVRILGNDYTHYKRKYPEIDFEILKKYMDIFIQQIEVSYMIKNPPVGRSNPHTAPSEDSRPSPSTE